MAIFRITSRTKRVALAKKTIRYIVHRRDRTQEPITRTLYDKFGQTDKQDAYETMDQAVWKTTFFRTVLSPDPRREDTHRDLDLRLLTEATMRRLAQRFKGMPFQYFASIHTDHSKNRHIHVVLLLEKQYLSRADLKAIRWAVTENARQQRRLLDKDTAQAVEEAPRGFKSAKTATIFFRSHADRRLVRGEQSSESSGGIPPHNPVCTSCGPFVEMERLTKTLFRCPACARVVVKQGMGMAVVREPRLELSLEQEVGSI
ncbi:MAG: hypothetical protein JO249_12940 [Acidobacteria bacterium]|nr:hypothetical protein [Acidobacteriota bacterium]